MATIKLLTAFTCKNNQNFINMNYSIFRRPNNFIISSTYMSQSKDYIRGNLLQRKKSLLLKEMQLPCRLFDSFKSTIADKDEDYPEEKEKIKEDKKEINIEEAKAKGASIAFKAIAYVIYATEIVLASNEVKLVKQLAIKGYYWVYNLFRVYVLQNPNVQDALNDVKGNEETPKKD